MWDENIGSDQIIERGGTICVGAKWVGDKDVDLFSTWEHGKDVMLDNIHTMMSVADAIVTYNGDKFDLPILRGEFVLGGFDPTPPVPSIDVYKTVKGFRLGIHKLGYVGPLLNVGEKVKHEGFGLWAAVMAGDEAAQDRMETYCKQDVNLLEKLYLRVLPFIKNHPHLGGQKLGACPSCGSLDVQSRGWRRTRAMRVQRVQCQGCGSWHDGRREKVG